MHRVSGLRARLVWCWMRSRKHAAAGEARGRISVSCYTICMSGFDSFFRFVLTFVLFIGISFGVTIGVNAYAAQQQAAAEQATALRALIGQGK